MAKVTSKLQVTVPKAIANAYGIRPGDEIEWVAADNVIRVVPARSARELRTADRLKLFDQVTERQGARQRRRGPKRPAADRGWTREELYQRGRVS
jgi:AbrB family looped-hinge helix DNA binding protein